MLVSTGPNFFTTGRWVRKMISGNKASVTRRIALKETDYSIFVDCTNILTEVQRFIVAGRYIWLCNYSSLYRIRF